MMPDDMQHPDEGDLRHGAMIEDKPRARRRSLHLPPMSVLPTLCTLGNLVAGFAAIAYAARPSDFKGPWGWSGLTFAGVLVILGMLLDAIDGWAARLTRSNSPLGGHLDSLADAVTFGVAPAFMMLQLVGRHLVAEGTTIIIGPEADDVLGRVVWAIAVVYLCCAALRLARFNVERGPAPIERRGSFRGLPSPGAAGSVTGLIILHQHLLVGRLGELPTALPRAAAFGIPFIALLCALAMVSSIPYAHVTNRYLVGARSFGYVVRLVVVLALAVWFPPEMLALLFTAYVLSGPAQLVHAKLRKARAPREAEP